MDVREQGISHLVKMPITVPASTPLAKVRETLLENKTRRAVVVDRKKPIGIITEKDISRKIFEAGSKPVKSILAKSFKPKKLHTLTADSSVRECARMLKSHRIGQVIILDTDKTMKGIITKTDLAAVFLTKSSAQVKVSQIMKRRVVTAAPSDPILYVESLLLKHKISRIVIKRDQKPVGIITFRDFVPAKIPQWIAESADPKEVQKFKNKTGLEEESHMNQMSYLFPFHATDIMTPNPVTVDMESDIKRAITLMIKHNVSGMPVVKKSKLVGMVTKSDVVDYLAK